MIIVLEGINGVGKTAISEYIKDNYNIPVFRNFRNSSYILNPRVANKAIEELAIAHFLSCIKIDSDLILDRSIISSYVYNTVFSHDNTIKFVHKNLLLWMDGLHFGPNGPLCIIHVDGAADKCVKRIEEKTKIFQLDGVNDVEMARIIQGEYNLIFANLKDSGLAFNFFKLYNNDSIDQLYQKIDEVMKKAINI